MCVSSSSSSVHAIHQQAASDVHALKGDALTFAKNVRSVEKVLAEAGEKGTLQNAKDACDELQGVMEEGLAHCHRLQTRYFITKLLLSAHDMSKFQELSDAMHRQLTVVATAASVSANSIVMEEFRQGRELASKVEALGGPDAIAADPEKRKACRSFMKDSDAVIAASVDAVGDAVREEGEKSRKHIEILSEENRVQQEVLQEQVGKLTTMMQALLKLRAGLDKEKEEDSADDEDYVVVAKKKKKTKEPVQGEGDSATAEATSNEAEERREGDADKAEEKVGDEDDDEVEDEDETEEMVDESAMSVDGVRAVIRSIRQERPAGSTEWDRRLTVKRAGLESEDVTDLIGDEKLRELTRTAVEELNVTDAYIGSIGATRQTYLSMTSKVDGVVQPSGEGMWWANDVGMCRHVVAKGDTLVSNGSLGGNAMPGAPNYSLDEIKTIAGSGNEDVGALLGVVGQVMMDPSGEIPHEQAIEQAWNPNGLKGPTFGAARSFLGCTAMSATSHYTGVPIKVGGQTVATFCVFDRARHRNDVSVDRVKALAEQASVVLERRVEERAARGEGLSMAEIIAKATAKTTTGPGAGVGAARDSRRAAAASRADRGEVIDLDEENFADVALDPSVDVAVMLVTPWCTHCADVKLAWTEAAKRQAGRHNLKRVIFATYNVQHEDPPTPVRDHASVWISQEVPALVLAPGSRGEVEGGESVGAAPEKFGPCGAGDVPRALRWLREKGVAVAFDDDQNQSVSTSTGINGGIGGGSGDGAEVGKGENGSGPGPSTAAVALVGGAPSAVDPPQASVALAAPSPGTLPDSASLAPPVAAVTTSMAAVVSAEDIERSRRANEVALEGLRRAMQSTSEVVAAWGGTCDALASTSPELAAAAAKFPDFLERSLAAQSATAREYVALSSQSQPHESGSGPLKPPPPGWEEAVRAQQEVNSNQARLLRTVAMAQQSGGGSGGGGGGLRAQIGELMRVSEGATARHLGDAMESFIVARGGSSSNKPSAGNNTLYVSAA